MKQIESNQTIRQIIAENTFVILQFGTETCMPCYAIEKRIDTWNEEHPEVTARYIPIETFQEEVSQLGIFTAPSVSMFVEGKQFLSKSGYFSLDEMIIRLEEVMQLYP